jgi:tetratricopeptide (TPR) repeat protein
MKLKHTFGLLLLLWGMGACTGPKKIIQKGAENKIAADHLTEAERMEVNFLFFNGQKEKLIGNFGVSENLFLEIIKRDPSNAQAYYEVGRTSLSRQQPARALEYAAKAAVLHPQNPWYLRLEADLLRQLGRQPEAITVLRKLSIMSEQDRVSILLDISSLHGEINQYHEAIKVLNEVEKLAGPAPELAEQKRQYWVKLKKPEKGIEEIRQLSEAFPMDAEFMLYLGQLYFEQGDYENSRKQFEKALKIEPENGKIYIALADTYRAKHDNKKAFSYLERGFAFSEVDIDIKVQVLLTLFEEFDRDPSVRDLALRLSKVTVVAHPEDAKAWAIRGDLMYHTRGFEDAVIAYKKAIDFDPGNQKYTVWQQYLFSLLETQQFAALGREGQNAVALFPNQPVPYFLGGLGMLQIKSYQQAIELLRPGVRMVYGNAELEAQFYAALGDGYHGLKQHEESDASYERALKIKPDNALVLNNYAYYLSIRKAKLDRAEEMSQRSLKLEPGNASYLDTYGWILYQLGRFAEARTYIEKALALSGENGTLLEHYGDVLYQLGEKDKAKQYWQRAKDAGGDVSEFIDQKLADGKLYE